MEQIVRESIVQLALEGARGDQEAFMLRLRKFISRVRGSEPELAEQLISSLGDGPILRERKISRDAAPVDADSRHKLLIEEYPVFLDVEPIWPEFVTKSLGRVVLEWEEQDALRELALSPVRSLLLSGPPGVGKTLAAKWLACKLDLPLLTLDLSTVMSSFLGKTGSNIKSVLGYAKSFPCILLLDEFDSIAKRRDDETDVGELKRLVTVLLQAIDEWPDTALLVAATNHQELLDPAVWRRFDLTLQIDQPSRQMIEAFLISSGLSPELSARFSTFFAGKSFGLIEKKILLAKKNSVLEKISLARAVTEQILEEFEGYSEDKKLIDLKIVAAHLEGKSNRDIGKIFNMAHTTVGRIIKTFI